MDEGLRFDSEAGSAVVDWPEIMGVYEAEHTCVLRMSGRFIVPIPKRPSLGTRRPSSLKSVRALGADPMRHRTGPCHNFA